MVSSAGSHLGRLIREARKDRKWSQDELRDKLRLSRPISISKWERGEAPVPVHHWRQLMEVLDIPKKDFLEAAKKDHHKQLPLFFSLTASIQDSATEIGSFAWDFIVKNLAPNTARQLERLRKQYPDLTPTEFARAAWEYFVEQARFGLDRNNRPIMPRGSTEIPPQGLVGQPPGRSAQRKQAVHHR